MLEPGDFDGNGVLDVADVDRLNQEIVTGLHGAEFDLNSDERVDGEDLRIWVKELKHTWIGDANLDSEFNSSDMVQVFVAGKYETVEAASWSEGAWNADAVFDSGDMVAAFVDGGYEQGLLTDGAAVPEPGGWLLLITAASLWMAVRRSRVQLKSDFPGAPELQRTALLTPRILFSRDEFGATNGSDWWLWRSPRRHGRGFEDSAPATDLVGLRPGPLWGLGHPAFRHSVSAETFAAEGRRLSHETGQRMMSFS